jgi:hypothetical protein
MEVAGGYLEVVGHSWWKIVGEGWRKGGGGIRLVREKCRKVEGGERWLGSERG